MSPSDQVRWVVMVTNIQPRKGLYEFSKLSNDSSGSYHQIEMACTFESSATGLSALGKTTSLSVKVHHRRANLGEHGDDCKV